MGRFNDQNPSKRKGLPTQKSLDALLSAYKNSEFETAEQLARELILSSPHHFFAWKVLGALLTTVGQYAAALEHTKRAVQLRPEDDESLNNMGHLLRLMQRHEEAESCLKEALQVNPRNAHASNNLGALLQEAGRIKEARDYYKNAIQIDPKFAKAYFNLGVLEKECGEILKAEVYYRQAIACDPVYADAFCNLGVILNELGHLEEAETNFSYAIKLRPEFAEAYVNRANNYRDLGLLLESETHYLNAIKLNPNIPEAHNNLGNVRMELGRYASALLNYEDAISRNPKFSEAFNNLGNCLLNLGYHRQAEQCFRKAIQQKPNYIHAYSNLLFSSNYTQYELDDEIGSLARSLGRLISSAAIDKYTKWAQFDGSQRLRVGFVSPDFRSHPVGYFIKDLFEFIDRARLELVCFSTSTKHDSTTDEIKKLVDSWFSICGLTDYQAAKLIHQRNVHLLFDLSGHTGGNRLGVFAYRPAPVQVSWLGYFATTGLPEIDYFVGDPVMCFESEQEKFTETLYSLADVWLCRKLPHRELAELISRAEKNFQALRLRQRPFTFGNFGNLAKITDDVIICWSNILKKSPESILFLKSNQLTDTTIQQRIRAIFSFHGIHADRLLLEGNSSHRDYLDSYSAIDLILDTFPYPGGTTTMDALSMGVPVLTIRGKRFLSRLGESILKNADLGSCIADDIDNYIQKAVNFYLNADIVMKTKNFLLHSAKDLNIFSQSHFAKNFENACFEMYKISKR